MDKAFQTQEKIVEALSDLLEEGNLNNVTVVDVCAKSGVSRSTFYRYFVDISDVALWWFDIVVQKSISSEAFSVHFCEERIRFLEQIRLHKALFTKAFTSERFGMLTKKAAQHGDDSFRRRVQNVHGYTMTDDESLLLEYYGHLTLCLMVKWAKDGMTVSSTKMADMLYAFFPTSLKKHIL